MAETDLTAEADVSALDAPGARRGILQILGPGLITGASDDDPSGIATYSQAGAQFGYALGWTLFFSWPLMCAIQEISARIGRVSGRGIAGNLRQHYPPAVVIFMVGLLVVANTINLGADVGAMGAALNLLLPGPLLLYVAAFGAVSVLLEVFVKYARYVFILKWLTVSLFAYVAVALVSHVPWASVGYHLLVPNISLAPGYLTVVVAVLGTTISPYLFFWQAGEEVEEVREADGAKPLVREPTQAASAFHRIRIDTWVGMALSNVVALFIVVTTAATLHAHGVTNIQTSSQAASALRPIAGQFAFVIFALGIIGTGLLAVPVLAGSAAYALGEALGWHVGLGRRDRYRRLDQLPGYRPDQGFVLERCHQRRGGRADHGDDHAHGQSEEDHGPVPDWTRPQGGRLAGDHRHGRRGSRHVRHHGFVSARLGRGRRA